MPYYKAPFQRNNDGVVQEKNLYAEIGSLNRVIVFSVFFFQSRISLKRTRTEILYSTSVYSLSICTSKILQIYIYYSFQVKQNLFVVTSNVMCFVTCKFHRRITFSEMRRFRQGLCFCVPPPLNFYELAMITALQFLTRDVTISFLSVSSWNSRKSVLDNTTKTVKIFS